MLSYTQNQKYGEDYIIDLASNEYINSLLQNKGLIKSDEHLNCTLIQIGGVIIGGVKSVAQDLETISTFYPDVSTFEELNSK